MKVVVALFLLFAAFAYSTPIAEKFEEVAPLFDAYRDVRILLSTRQNRNNPQQLSFRNLASVQQSHFNRNVPTRVLIHAWIDGEQGDLNVATSAELLDYNDFNILFIDWSLGSRTINYATAVSRVEPVGSFIASQLDFLHENGFINFNQLTIIGFSLGAHVAGFAGKNVRRGRVNSIIGLDPANLLFSVRNPAGRIDAGDAHYVEIIHTNGQTLVGSGIGEAIGDADFWPNGGSTQPGCLTNICSHGRSVEYYVESIQNNQFHSLRCPARNDVSARRCTSQPGAWMGGDGVNFNKAVSGCFYLETNRNAPFARGQLRPSAWLSSQLDCRIKP